MAGAISATATTKAIGMTDRLLRLAEAGKRLGEVKAKTVRAWIQRRKLIGIRLPSGHWRVTESAIVRYLEENKNYPE